MNEDARPGGAGPDRGEGASDLADPELIAEIDAELAAERATRRTAGPTVTGAVLLLGGLIGWLAALSLTVDKLYLLQNPGATLSCDINPLISCGTVMLTWQSEALGVPNMAIGLGGFAIMGVVGSLLLSKVALPHWLSWATVAGMTFAFGYVHFLAISAIFVIGALCPWCLVVWTVTAPMFFAALAHTVEERLLPVPRPVAGVLRRWVPLTLAWYLLVIIVIALAFLPQWMAMLGLS